MRLLLPPSRTIRDAIGASVPIDHYTGTLYKALGAEGWIAAQRDYALDVLVIHDKERGPVAAGSWEPVELAALPGFVLDARSKEYVRLVATPPGAWMLRVVSEDAEGRRLAISHWNKHHKGVLAHALIRDRARVEGVNDLVAWSRAAGLNLEVVAEGELDLLV